MNASRMDEPAALVDLVDYQAGSVVSQALMKTRTGTVTVFARSSTECVSYS